MKLTSDRSSLVSSVLWYCPIVSTSLSGRSGLKSHGPSNLFHSANCSSPQLFLIKALKGEHIDTHS